MSLTPEEVLSEIQEELARVWKENEELRGQIKLLRDTFSHREKLFISAIRTRNGILAFTERLSERFLPLISVSTVVDSIHKILDDANKD